MNQDIADVRIAIKIKHIYAVLGTVVVVTTGAVAGYFSLRSDIADAKTAAGDAQTSTTILTRRVETIECLVRQQNNFQIYGVKPISDCK